MSLSMKKRPNKQGIIQIIVVLIIALLIIHFLNISLSGLLAKQSVRDFFIYVWGLTKIIWQDFLLLLNFIRGIVQSH